MHDAVCRKLTDEGRLIEAGWVALRLAAIPSDAPQVQIDEMRKAFFAGAQHLFASIMSILEPGDEPTDKDLERIGQINAELDQYVAQLKRGGSGHGK
jgi:hypothetical protein